MEKTRSFTVRRVSESWVVARPSADAEPLPPSGNLPLSWVDRIPSNKMMQDTIQVFKHGEKPAKVIKSALERALVPYSPMAGVLVLNGSGELEVECNNNGVWFVEAFADFSLEEVRYLDLPFMIPVGHLLPPSPSTIADESDIMVMIQVTEFKCGGFVFGLRANHAIADGTGASQFIKAVSDVARGHPVVDPIWCRDLLPVPKKLPGGIPIHLPPAFTDLQITVVDVPDDFLNHHKTIFFQKTGERCSSFDVLGAKAWQCRARAIDDLEPTAAFHIIFPMSLHHLLNKLIDESSGTSNLISSSAATIGGGYYGNCIHLLSATATRSEVANGSLTDLVKKIRVAKAGLSENYFRWLKGDSEEDPSALASSYGAMFLSDWSKLQFLDADYGWGRSVNLSPTSDSRAFNRSVALKPPEPKGGLRLWSSCVTKKHVEAFLDEMASGLDDDEGLWDSVSSRGGAFCLTYYR